ncbi:MAG: hypothetical protein ABSG79_03615 [Bryobacteraceae bacterium]
MPLSLTRKVNQSGSVSTATARVVALAWRMTLVRISCKDAEDGEGGLGGQTSAVGETPTAATNSGARFEFLELPGEGRGQPEILENIGAQLSGDPADRVHGQVDAADKSGDAAVEFTPGFGRAGAMQRGQGFEIELQQREHLAELIVDFA